MGDLLSFNIKSKNEKNFVKNIKPLVHLPVGKPSKKGKVPKLDMDKLNEILI